MSLDNLQSIEKQVEIRVQMKNGMNDLELSAFEMCQHVKRVRTILDKTGVLLNFV